MSENKAQATGSKGRTAAQKAKETELEAKPGKGAEAKETGVKAQDTETETQDTGTTGQLLFVTAPASGFRRAGRFWPGGVTEVSADEFTAEQLEQLRSEPSLTVIEAET